MEQALLLNASYEPLKVVNWQKAITLWCQGKVEVIAVHDREVRAVSVSFKLPSVIRLLRFVRIKRRYDYVPFSRANIYARDDHTQRAGKLARLSVLERRARRNLAVRGERPSAFVERCILAAYVAPPSHTGGILDRRALSARRLACLGATPDFHHGTLGRESAVKYASQR